MVLEKSLKNGCIFCTNPEADGSLPNQWQYQQDVLQHNYLLDTLVSYKNPFGKIQITENDIFIFYSL